MNRRDYARAGALTIFAGVVLASVPARAAEGSDAAAGGNAAARDEAEARVLFAEARRLAAAGDYVEACPKFEDSLRLNPGIGTTFNLADCFEHLGRTASAWARFLDVAGATKVAGQPDRERVARERAAALEPRLSRIVVIVDLPVDGMTVQRDAVVVAASAWGVAVPVDPGVHAIHVTAPNRKPWSTEVSVPAGDPTTVSVSIPALEFQPEPPAPLPAATLVTPTLPPPERRLTLPAVLLGSVGIAGLAAGAFLGIRFLQENSEAKGLCRPVDCSTDGEKAQHAQLVSDATRDRNWEFVAVGVGGVALAAATVLWWRSAERSTARTGGGVAARPLAGTHGIGGEFAIAW